LLIKKLTEAGIPIKTKLRIKPTNPKSGDRPSWRKVELHCRRISKIAEKEIPETTNGTEITMIGLIDNPRPLLIHIVSHVRKIVTETGEAIS